MRQYPKTFSHFIESQYSLFVQILEIPNPSDGEEEIRIFLQNELQDLGADIRIDVAGNLIGYLGSGKNPFLLGGHLDSVQPCEGIKVKRDGDIVSSSGDTILSADDGAGIFEVLTAVRYLKEQNIPTPPIDILFTVGEEIGGKGVRALNKTDIRAEHGMLLDRADDPGVFVIAGPFKRNFKVEFKGKAVHAFEAEKGVSAIHMAAACVAQFPQGKINEGLYANIGHIEGGDAVNKVAEYACVEGEVRALKREDAETLLEEYQRIVDSIQYKFSLGRKDAPTADLQYTARREGYHHDPEGEMVKLIHKVHEKIGIISSPQITRACSDAGDLTNKGIDTINYANGARGVHTADEWIDMKDVKQITWFLVNLLEELGSAE